jgi:hypothetical protein
MGNNENIGKQGTNDSRSVVLLHLRFLFKFDLYLNFQFCYSHGLDLLSFVKEKVEYRSILEE